jgi:tRNA (guanosine-2'-O-)-methyltransferase
MIPSENVPEPSPEIEVNDQIYEARQVVELLGRYMTDRRKRRIREVVEQRTRTVVPVVEGLYDMGNVSAVLRSAEALGYYSVHVIESSEHFKHSSRTSSGAEKWIDLTRWSKPNPCYDRLEARGYALIVTHLEGSVPLDEIDFTRPTAVVFGNEADGVSRETLARADHRCRIPIVGFVESYNVSVAAALTLYHAYHQRVNRLDRHGDLSPAERIKLMARYYLRSVGRAEQILQRYDQQ